ncbi:hypothetical protein ACP4OV_017853 [Aristida adscensionis]
MKTSTYSHALLMIWSPCLIFLDILATIKDVLALITQISELGTVQLPNQPAPTHCRDLIIRDLSSTQVRLTLWGQRAVEFSVDEIPDREPTDPLVVLFVGTLMKSFAGEDYLSGNAACRWYFNPDIPEAQSFYAAPHAHHPPVAHVPAPVQQGHQPNVPVQVEHKQLDELEAMDPYDFPDNGFHCTVVIARLVPETTWWFPSCNRCSRTCSPDGAGYKCNACSCDGYRFKYKLSFIACDGSAEAEMIAFGDIARRIVGKPVQTVLRECKFSNGVPPDISAIVSLRFTFGINITEQSYFKPTKTYQVNSIITAYGRQPSVQRLLAAQATAASNPVAPSPPSHAHSSGVGPSDIAIASAAPDTDDATDDLLDTNKASGSPVAIPGSKIQKQLFSNITDPDVVIPTDQASAAAKILPAASDDPLVQPISKSLKATVSDSKKPEAKLGRPRKANGGASTAFVPAVAPSFG